VSAAATPCSALVWDVAALRWEPAPPGPPGEGWIHCADLLAPGSAELDRHLAVVAERQRTARPSVTASLLLERHAWALATAAFGSLLGEGLLPDLAAANVAVRLDADGFAAGLLLEDPFLEEVAPAAALEPLARGLLAAHLLPLVERLAQRDVHRGRRALRCLVVDALAAGIAGAAGPAETRAAEAAALAVALAAILGTPPGLHPRLLPVDGGLVRKRAVCCLLHTERRAHCATCPHLSDAETVRRCGPMVVS
jgi:hypothetical protein